MSKRLVGTQVTGLRAPIFKEGDNLPEIVSNTFVEYLEETGTEIGKKDVLAITESVVARSQGNYVSIDGIAEDVADKFGDDVVGLVFPILSRNRFAIALRGIARGVAKKIVLMLSYPSDEVGNHLVWISRVDEKGVNPWTDTLSEKEFRDHFGYEKHTFTGVDYIEYYKEIIEAEGKECEIIFSNNPLKILDYTKSVLQCDIHTAERTERRLEKAGVEKLYGLRHICAKPRKTQGIAKSDGYNMQYGLLGSNKSDEEHLKLFPRDCNNLVRDIQSRIKEKTGKSIEVMVYGDGAFKDPVGKIWELADPVVSPGFTDGLDGTPHELKLKYIADNSFPDLAGEELEAAIKKYIEDNKPSSGKDAMDSQGTTPRRITDLLGSLCDLTSGSGDKGTPMIYIRGYFDNITTA